VRELHVPTVELVEGFVRAADKGPRGFGVLLHPEVRIALEDPLELSIVNALETVIGIAGLRSYSRKPAFSAMTYFCIFAWARVMRSWLPL
jgi:hypothetical protein